MSDPSAAPFSASRLRAHRERAARGAFAGFLAERAAEDIAERLCDVNRRFETGLAIGAPSILRAALAAGPAGAKIDRLFGMDVAPALAGAGGFVGDLERWPLRAGAFDLIVALPLLHWANDLPGALTQLRLALKPDGLFIGALFGGETLTELRAALIRAEAETIGGAAARVAPFARTEDMAHLLQRAGFVMPVADLDRVAVSYAHPLRLLADLRAMGETSALADAAPPLRRATLARLLALYPRDETGAASATFEIVFATGWAPR